MRKLTSVFLVLSMVFGLMSGLSLAPWTGASAEENDAVPGKVTVIDFADMVTYPDAGALAEIKVASGSAIGFSAGGKAEWNYGIIIIEPDEGWSLERVFYGDEEISLNTEKLSSVISKVRSDAENTIPDAVDEVFNGYGNDTDNVDAIYVDRALYNKIWDDHIVLSYIKDSEKKTYDFKLNRDHTWISYTVEVGTEFNVFDIEEVEQKLLINGYGRKDYEVGISSRNSTANDAMKILFESSDSEDYGKVKAVKSGQFIINLKNLKN
ncbi:MAG: hypothetical protein K5795_05670, partial [Lachnospiraceae bacterium]|nr:hypothetical protein [Lachnospiraceae bacterium]